MTIGKLEHANITVSNPDKTAAMLSNLFGWHIRWHGAAMNGGRTVHVGGDADYLALYTPREAPDTGPESYGLRGGLNHVGVVVDDLDATEARVEAAGFKPHNHGNYEPGRRFYFHDGDGIEWEVVSYASPAA